MREILCLLKAWYESSDESEQLENLYYVDEQYGIRIPYRDVDVIVNGYYGMQEQNERLYETLEEKEDYIRLLRKENQELKELQNG
jgi:hypothetical protein